MPLKLSIHMFSVVINILCAFIFIRGQETASPIFPQISGDAFNLDDITGHLKKFGQQRPPTGMVDEYWDVVTPKQLWDDHVSKSR